MTQQVRLHLCNVRPLVLALLLGWGTSASAQALPGGATVVNGTVGINTFSNGLQVINSPGAIIHWDSFSIGNGRTVRFDQLTSQSAVLNRVTGNAHSEILGSLQSNGRVFLLNPNGILFGAGARVDVAGLLASTLNISDADFLAGNYRFSCFNATVCESGVDTLNPFNNRIVLKDGSQITTRTAGEGGQVWLIARDRITSEKGSKIEAPTGQVIAAAAREVTIASPALGNMTFTLTGTAGSRIDLAGDIDVPRGAAGFFADTIRLAGNVRALSDVDAAGQIVARAASEISVDGGARLDVSGTDGADAGSIRLKAVQKISVQPTADIGADSGLPTAQRAAPKGGLIELEAYQVSLPWNIPTNGVVQSYVQTHAPIHAYARSATAAADAADTTRARYGRVNVLENGTFTFEAVSTPFLAAGQEVIRTVRAGDGGSVLVVTEKDFAMRVRVISADGQTLSTVSDLVMPAGTWMPVTETVPLAGGGWMVVMRMDVMNQYPLQVGRVWVFGPQGQQMGVIDVAAKVDFGPQAERLPYNAMGYDAWALAGGGFALRTPEGNSHTVRVYNSTGQLDSAATAASASLLPPTSMKFITYFHRPSNSTTSFVEYDARQTWVPLLANNIVEPRLVDAQTGEVRSSAAFEAYGKLGNQYLVMSYDETNLGGGTLTHREYDQRGIVDSTGAFLHTPVHSTLRAEVFPNSSTRIWEERDTQDLVVLGTDLVAVTRLQDRYDLGRDGTWSSSVSLLKRVPVAAPFAGTGTAGSVLTPPLLASMPGQGNGVQQGGSGPVAPPVDPGPTGQSPAAAPRGELPPPTYFSPTAGPRGFEVASAPMGVPAARTNSDKPETEEEFLAYAGDFVEGLLGKPKADALRRATTPEQRAPIMQEAAYAIAVGEDIYKATSDMGQDMRGALFNSWAGTQLFGLEDEEGFSEGLHRALTQKKPGTPNEDGSTGPERTRLQIPLDVLELELKQATTEEEKTRIGRRVLRELVLAARAEAGQEVDDTADLELPDGKGGTVRITDDGDLVTEGKS